MDLSCQPYPEGPKISFHSKSDRISNTWAVEFVYDRRTRKDITEDFTNYVAVVNADGTYMGRVTEEVNDSTTITHIQEGLWDFVEDDEELRILFTEPLINPDREFWKILRLRQEEFWFERDQIINGDTTLLEYRMVPGDTTTSGN